MMTKFRIGLVATVFSMILLAVVAFRWFTDPVAAAEIFRIVPDSTAADAYAWLAATFKGIIDILPIIVLIPLMFEQNWRAAGWVLLISIVLIPIADMLIWPAIIAAPSLLDVAIHAPFALAMGIGAYCFLTLPKEAI